MGPAEVTWSSLNQSLSRSGPGHLPICGLERRCVRGVWDKLTGAKESGGRAVFQRKTEKQKQAQEHWPIKRGGI